MSNDNSLSLPELNDRIAVLQDNMRQLVEQAAGSSARRMKNEHLNGLLSSKCNSTSWSKRVTPS